MDPEPRRPSTTYGPILSGSHLRSASRPGCDPISALPHPRSRADFDECGFKQRPGSIMPNRSGSTQRLANVRADEEGEKPRPVRSDYSLLSWAAGTPHGDGNHGVAHRPSGGKARLDDGIDQVQSLVKPGERAFHRVNRQPFDVGPAIPELLN